LLVWMPRRKDMPPCRLGPTLSFASDVTRLS
jgi:hypothetical protein